MKNLRRFCLACDLVDDFESIVKYKNYHKKVWPEISKSLSDAGIVIAEIYCVGNRLFMILEVNESFSFENKAKMDSNNPKVQEWENLMQNYQKALPCAAEDEKWVLMEKIYSL